MVSILNFPLHNYCTLLTHTGVMALAIFQNFWVGQPYHTFTFTTSLFAYTGMVDSHVCILQESFDVLSRANLWTMPRKELCWCQKVVAPTMLGSRSCPRRRDTDALEDIWHSDDPSLITLLTDPRNWTAAKLDKHLERSYCCKLYIVHILLQYEQNIQTST